MTPQGRSRRPRVAVVTPILNESSTIREILHGLLRTLQADYDLTVIVIDDGSEDGSAEIVRALSQDDPRVAYLTRNGPKGVGGATRLGLKHSLKDKPEVILTIDADGEHPLEYIAGLLRAILGGFDLALCSRYVKGGRTLKSWREFFISRLFNFVLEKLSGCNLKDFTTGFRAMSSPLARRIMTETKDEGFSFQAEATLLACRNRAKILEKPFVQRYRVRGESKFSLARELPAFIRLLGRAITTGH